MVDGVHYTRHVEQVRALRRSGDDDAAAGLLLRLIDAVEREAAVPLPGYDRVPPWFFRQLAAIYRKAGMFEAAADVARRFQALSEAGELRARVPVQLRLEQLGRPVAAATATPEKRRVREAQAIGFWIGRTLSKLMRRR